MAAPTMRITGAGCTLIGPEGRTPPLPFITVDAGEAESLIAQKLATPYTGEEAEEDAADPAADTPTNPDPAADPEPEPEPDAPADEDRAAAIAEALDLMEADDLVKTGERAGKPKVSAIEAATGLADVTAEEIDAVIAANEAVA